MNFTTLGIELDKKGNELLIKHCDNISWTPAYSFFLKELADTIDNKNLPPYTWWDDEQPGIIWAEDHGKVVGIICYDKSYTKKALPHFSIILTAVHKEHRQIGIHQIMNRYFEKVAKDQKCFAIRATVNLNNTVRIVTAEKDNLKPLLIIMTKEL
jgi:ribosomal protein S18 acetylase RimI-like enzyme